MPVNTISGTDGFDNLSGEPGRDLFLALAGNDWIVTTQGRDTVDCGSGNDTVFAYSDGVHLLGGEGDDQLVVSDLGGARGGRLSGGLGDDRLFAGTGRDTALGGQGNDTVTVYFQETGRAEGGSGNDRLSLLVFDGTGLASDEPVVLVLTGAEAGATVGGTRFLSLAGFESLSADLGDGDDQVRGGRLSDHIALRGGSNSLQARGGDDQVAYETGALNDLSGGAGRDRLQVVQADSAQALLLSVAGNRATDQFGSVLRGFKDYIVYAGEAADRLIFGAGDDAARARGGDDTILGGRGQDSLLGAGGQDDLAGGAGDDALSGGAGADRLTGGAGADRFRISGQAAADLITDFAPGQDLIVLARLAFGPGLTKGPLTEDRFALDQATLAQGQFLYRPGQGGPDLSALYWDADGTGAADAVLIARFTGLPALDAGSFLIL